MKMLKALIYCEFCGTSLDLERRKTVHSRCCGTTDRNLNQTRPLVSDSCGLFVLHSCAKNKPELSDNFKKNSIYTIDMFVSPYDLSMCFSFIIWSKKVPKMVTQIFINVNSSDQDKVTLDLMEGHCHNGVYVCIYIYSICIQFCTLKDYKCITYHLAI